jgi:hypothetical protein
LTIRLKNKSHLRAQLDKLLDSKGKNFAQTFLEEKLSLFCKEDCSFYRTSYPYRGFFINLKKCFENLEDLIESANAENKILIDKNTEEEVLYLRKRLDLLERGELLPFYFIDFFK